MFQRAFALFQAGQLADAERSFKELLHAHPTHAGALNLLAILTMQTGASPKPRTMRGGR
jgi:Flp pilus assembly protein TadD